MFVLDLTVQVPMVQKKEAMSVLLATDCSCLVCCCCCCLYLRSKG